jgi:hypothetical protein
MYFGNSNSWVVGLKGRTQAGTDDTSLGRSVTHVTESIVS